jgi:hypothetical protein
MATTKIDVPRPIRVCDVCGGFDDHPRHVIGHAANEAPAVDQAVVKALAVHVDFTTDEGGAAIADLMDTTLQLRHMDCCASVGCPDGTCVEIHRRTPAPANSPLRGDDLLEFLTSGAVDDVPVALGIIHPPDALHVPSERLDQEGGE